MTTRRDFLTRLARTAAGLYLADDVSELLLEPRRKLWPGASFGETFAYGDIVALKDGRWSRVWPSFSGERLVLGVWTGTDVTVSYLPSAFLRAASSATARSSSTEWTERAPKAYLEV